MFAGSDLIALAEQEMGHGEHADTGTEGVAVGTPFGTPGDVVLDAARSSRPTPLTPAAAPTTLNEAFVLFRLPPSLHATFLQMVGSEDGEDEADVVAHVPPLRSPRRWTPRMTVMGNLLAPIQKGHVMKFLKNLRRTFAENASPRFPHRLQRHRTSR